MDYADAFRKILCGLRGDNTMGPVVTETEHWIRIEDEHGVRMLNKNAVSQITIFDKKEPPMMKQCRLCHKKFEPSRKAHLCHVAGHEVGREDDNDFIDTAIAVAVATELLSGLDTDCGSSSDSGSSSCDVPDTSSDFGGGGGDFGGGGSSSDW